MEINVAPTNLAAGLRKVSLAVRKNTILPVLQNVLLVAEDGRLRMAATDLETTVCYSMAVQVVKEGAVTAPCRTLVDMTRNMRELLLTVRADDSATVTLQGGRSKSTLKGMAASEFPALAQSDGTHATVSAAGLRQAITQTVFAAASENSGRAVLAGVCLQIAKGALTVIAADGVRLSVSDCAAEVIEPLTVIIPARAAGILARLLAGVEKDVKIWLTPDKSQVIFDLDDTTLVAQLVEGAYPDYTAIVPSSWTTQAVMDKEALRIAMAQAGIFARDNGQVAHLKVAPGSELTPGQITVWARSVQTGDVTTLGDAVIEGDPVEVALNVQFLRQALEATPTDQVVLAMGSPESPCVVRPVGYASGIQHVIMPIQNKPPQPVVEVVEAA